MICHDKCVHQYILTVNALRAMVHDPPSTVSPHNHDNTISGLSMRLWARTSTEIKISRTMLIGLDWQPRLQLKPYKHAHRRRYEVPRFRLGMFNMSSTTDRTCWSARCYPRSAHAMQYRIVGAADTRSSPLESTAAIPAYVLQFRRRFRTVLNFPHLGWRGGPMKMMAQLIANVKNRWRFERQLFTISKNLMEGAWKVSQHLHWAAPLYLRFQSLNKPRREICTKLDACTSICIDFML